MSEVNFKCVNGFPVAYLEDDDYDNEYIEEMDAVDFVKIGKRMCNKYKLCTHCPVLEMYPECKLRFDTIDNPEKLVATIAYWGRHNPEKTNREKFFETFGKLSYEDRQLIMSDEFGFQRWLEKEYKKPEENYE